MSLAIVFEWLADLYLCDLCLLSLFPNQYQEQELPDLRLKQPLQLLPYYLDIVIL